MYISRHRLDIAYLSKKISGNATLKVRIMDGKWLVRDQMKGTILAGKEGSERKNVKKEWNVVIKANYKRNRGRRAINDWKVIALASSGQ